MKKKELNKFGLVCYYIGIIDLKKRGGGCRWWNPFTIIVILMLLPYIFFLYTKDVLLEIFKDVTKK